MKNAKTIIIVAVIVIALVLTIYFVGKRAGKATTPKEVPIPSDTQGKSVNPNFNPGPYTDALFEDIDQIFGIHEAEPYINLNKLSNSELVVVYNDWNQRYYKKAGNETLPQAMRNEWTVWNSEWLTVGSLILDRYDSLGLQ